MWLSLHRRLSGVQKGHMSHSAATVAVLKAESGEVEVEEKVLPQAKRTKRKDNTRTAY